MAEQGGVAPGPFFGMILRVSGRTRLFAAAADLIVTLDAATGLAQELPRGEIVDIVKCAADSTQSYALYIPSTYSPDRTWSLLIAFHPGARGRAMVETYR